MRVLVTGVTGYIGGRLVPLLLEAGHEVRVLVRDPKRLEARPWVRDVELIRGSAEIPGSVTRAVQGVDAAYYLVHAMCSRPGSARSEQAIARSFSEAAKGIPQVIYLGGILPDPRGKEYSADLRSRAEVGEILASMVPTTELRAGPIIGSGSVSFEMIRFLVERLPLSVGPRWIQNQIQPISIRDVLAYLVAAVGREDVLGVFDLGADPLTFRQMMLQYAEEKGLHRVVLPLPVRAVGLSALWVSLATPLPNCLSTRLVRGMAKPVLGDTGRSRQLFPEIQPVSYRKAVELALGKVQENDVRTRWSDARGRREPRRLGDMEGLVREVRTCVVDASPEAVFRAVSTLGGDRGWLVWDWAWRLRGLLDKLVGGPGLRRGRRDPTELLPGDAVDFWRVEEVEAPRILRLRAEMKVPGRAWLQWETREEHGQTHLVQAALFEPRGLWGWAYWYGSYPFHGFIFDGMVDAIAGLAMADMSGDSGRESTF